MTKNTYLEGLSWLHDEIVMSLDETVEELAMYQESRQIDSLERCRELLQQIQGSLQIVGCTSGMTLLAEMLDTVRALQKRSAVLDDGWIALAQAIDVLPRHLARLQQGAEDHPALLMALLNDLRAVRGQPLFSEGADFAPGVSSLATAPPVLDDPEEWQAQLQTLSHFYQAQLIPLLKGALPQDGLRRLIKVIDPLEVLFAGSERTYFWRAAGGFLEALLSGRVVFGGAARTLLGGLERELRLAAERGAEIRLEPMPFGLMQNLLFYVALAGRSSPRRESLWREFSLEQSLPATLICEQQIVLADELVAALSLNFSVEVAAIKTALEEYLADDGVNVNPLHEVLQLTQRMGTALTMAGQPELKALLRVIEERLQQAVRDSEAGSGVPGLDSVAVAIVDLEFGLYNWSASAWQRDLSGTDEIFCSVMGARQQLLEEIGRDLEDLKGEVVEQLDKDTSTLPATFRDRLQHLAKVLPIAGLPHCATVADGLLRVTEQRGGMQYAALADVLTGVERYLKNCRAGRDAHQEPLRWAEAALAVMVPMSLEKEIEEMSSPDGQPAGVSAPLDSERHEESDADDDLRAIFIAEAREVLGSLQESYPRWQADPTDTQALADTRRVFHTLKGSGRMVQAHLIGEFSWAIENLLNRVMERRISVSAGLYACIESAMALLPALVATFERADEEVDDAQVQDLQRHAEALARGETIEAVADECFIAEPPPGPVDESLTESEGDSELLEIFLSEAHAHLDMVRRFYNEQYHRSPMYAPPGAVMQSALHTLKGSAHMAGIEPLAQVATALEQVSRGLLTTQTPVDEDSLSVFHDGSVYIEEMLQTLAAGDGLHGSDARLTALLKRCSECRSRIPMSDWGGMLLGMDVPVDRLLHALMQDCLDQLIAMEHWLECGSDGITTDRDRFPLLAEELAGAAIHAAANGCTPMEELATALGAAATRLSQWPAAEALSADWRRTLLQARESLLQMCDALAANQDINATSSSLLTALTDVGGQWIAHHELTDDLRARVAQLGLSDEADREIVELFLSEAEELLEVLEQGFHEWREDVANREPLEALKRALHTFKGGARMAALDVLAEICHELETEVERNEGRVLAGEEGPILLMLAYHDALAQGIERMWAKVRVVNAVEQVSALPDAPEAPAATPAMTPAMTSIPGWPTAEIIPFAGVQRDLGDSTPEVDLGNDASQEAVRLAAPMLDLLVNLAGEASISRGQVEQHVHEFMASLDEMETTIRRMHDQVRRLGIETDAQVMFRREQVEASDGSVGFDPLEMDRYSQLQQLSRSLLESASDLQDLRDTLLDKSREAETLLLHQSRINTDLQEHLMRTRMVPFTRMVPRLRRIVRQVGSALDKQVVLQLESAEGELDRNILERIVPALEHMVRNAIDHGIESAHERLALGKPAEGALSVSLTREGGDVLIRLADDGRGLDVEAIRAKAIDSGLMSQNSLLSEQEVQQFIFAPGLSTARDLSDVSGRGVGMDVVNSEVRQLGGSVAIHSQPGVGTAFTVRLPFTLSVNRALMIRVKDDAYALPLNTITGVTRIAVEELLDLYQNPHETFLYGGDSYQLRYLGSLLSPDVQPMLDTALGRQLPVILMRSEDRRYAVQVDGLDGSREVVVKTLGAQFSRVPGLSGATVLGDGSVVVILDLPAVLREQVAAPMPAPTLVSPAAVFVGQGSLEKSRRVSTVMVVDDSVTVRKVTTRFLEREGYQVLTAKDGIDAMRLLQDHTPDLMLLDIEMPRMDGFEVTRLVRSTQRLKDLPIVMITSRTGEKHRERALSMGADNYLGKPYQEEVLVEVVHDLLQHGRASVTGGQAG